MHVIAKAYGDEPLQRVVTGRAGATVYLLHPSVVNACGTAPFSGVGFPAASVFNFDLAVFDSLSRAWQSSDAAALSRAWAMATPLANDDKEAA